VIVTGAAALGAMWWSSQRAEVFDVPRRQVVVVVVVDTLRWDSLGVYGNTRRLTPTMDRLAENGGVVFEHAYAASNHTYPSVASIMTGTYPTRHGFWGPYVRPERLPHNLATALPDDVVTILANGNPNTVDAYYSDFDFAWAAYPYPPSPFADSVYFPATEVFGQAVALAASAQWPDQLLIYVQPVDPHDPYFPLEHYPDLFVGDPLAETVSGRRGTPLSSLYWDENTDKLAEAELRNIRNRYDAEVRFTDKALGAFLDTLSGHYEDRVVIVTSDHGESFLDHDDASHGTSLYDEQIRIPLVVNDTRGRFGPSRLEPALVSHVDILPTVAELFGAVVDVAMDGVPLREVVEQFSVLNPMGRRRTVVSEVVHSTTVVDFDKLPSEFTALRSFKASPVNLLIRANIDYARQGAFGDGLFKYIRNESRETTSVLRRFPSLYFQPHFSELFRLDQDPGERHPLDNGRIARRISQRSPLADVFPSMGVRATPLSAEQLDRLRAVGYIR